MTLNTWTLVTSKRGWLGAKIILFQWYPKVLDFLSCTIQNYFIKMSGEFSEPSDYPTNRWNLPDKRTFYESPNDGFPNWSNRV